MKQIKGNKRYIEGQLLKIKDRNDEAMINNRTTIINGQKELEYKRMEFKNRYGYLFNPHNK